MMDSFEALARMECPQAHEGHEGYLEETGSGQPCPTCQGTGLRWPGLTEECWCPTKVWHQESSEGGSWWDRPCQPNCRMIHGNECVCNGTGRVPIQHDRVEKMMECLPDYYHITHKWDGAVWLVGEQEYDWFYPYAEHNNLQEALISALEHLKGEA